MKKLLIVLLLFFVPMFGFSQSAQPIFLTSLFKRIQQGNDSIYIVNFWATWCAPCVKELPDFDALQQNFKDQKLKIILINVDFKSALQTSLSTFLQQNKFKSEVFWLDETNQEQYINRVDSTWSGALPATLLISKKNRRFYEQPFTYTILQNAYLTFKNTQ